MDATATKRNADRFADEDLLNARGRPTIANIDNPRLLAILEFLSIHRYATFDDLIAHLGGDPTSLRRLIQVAKSRSNRLLHIPDQISQQHNVSKKVVYELGARGVQILKERGHRILERPVSNFDHATLAAHATASIQTGIDAQPNASLITWDQIKQRKKTPATDASSPFDIPYQSVDGPRHVRADSPIFGIKLDLGTHSLYRFFPGIEADNATKSDRLIAEQLSAYLAIERDRIPETYYAFPPKSWYVPFLVRNAHQADRVKWMIEILNRLTNGAGSKTILFMRYNPDGKPGYLFTEPWWRAGYEPVYLNK